MIQFDSEQHKYVRNNEDFISVTTLLHKYQKPFNKEYWSLYKSLQSYLGYSNDPESKKLYSKFLFRSIPGFQYENIDQIKNLIKLRDINLVQIQQDTQQAWKDKNKSACDKGTEIHSFMENKDILNQYGDISNKVAPLIAKPTYEDLKVGYYSELRLYLDEFNLAGTADKVLIYEKKGKKYFYIADYKTNEKLTFDNKYQKLLPPLSHLEDTKFNIYALQMSIYSYMLEKQFKIRYGHSELIHYENYDVTQVKTYTTPYLKREVVDLLRHYKLSLKKKK